MREIEKNDVDVFELFNWKKKVNIGGKDGKTIWMRIVGDNDLQRARVYGFRKSAEMRKKLRTDDTDERLAFLMDSEQFEDKGLLVESILLLSIESFRSDAIKEVDLPLPTEPSSEAGIEAQEKYQQQVDEYPKKFSQLVADKMHKRTQEERESYGQKSFEELYKTYEKMLIDRLATEELTKAYYSKLVYFSCFSDEECKNKFFESFEEFDNYPVRLKELLIGEYQMLDLTTDSLKK